MLLRIKFISVGEEKLKYEFEKQEKDLVVSYLYKLIIKKKKISYLCPKTGIRFRDNSCGKEHTYCQNFISHYCLH